jgi:hypothetical protein
MAGEEHLRFLPRFNPCLRGDQEFRFQGTGILPKLFLVSDLFILRVTPAQVFFSQILEGQREFSGAHDIGGKLGIKDYLLRSNVKPIPFEPMEVAFNVLAI